MRKKKTRPWLLIAGIALLIACIAGVWFETGRQDRPERYQLEKKGADVSVDYTAACVDLHTAVDSVLAKQKVMVKQVETSERQVPRTPIEGTIRWHSRQLLVEKPAELSADALIKALEAALPQVKGKVLAVAQSDSFNGIKTQRLDIGLQDQLDGDSVTIISDKIFIIEATVRKPVKAKADMAIIIDDFGYAAEPISAFAAIKQPLTFSVLPNRPYSNEAAANALSAGHQVMLHMPMEPLNMTSDREPVFISSAMNDNEIRAAFKQALASVPGAIGINNHQGSKATADSNLMRAVMTVIKSHKLFFVDSRTTAATVAAAAARQAKIRTAENDLFIDNNPEVSAIKEQLRKATQLALQHGSFIVIGHARPTTVIALREMLPEMEAAGIRLVFVSQLVK